MQFPQQNPQELEEFGEELMAFVLFSCISSVTQWNIITLFDHISL